MRSGEVHHPLLTLYQGLGTLGKSWQVPGLKTLRNRFVSPVKLLVKVGPGNYSTRIQKSFLPSIAMDVAPRGSLYPTIKELGPKISDYRRNYGSQFPNGCICGTSGEFMCGKAAHYRTIPRSLKRSIRLVRPQLDVSRQKNPVRIVQYKAQTL